MKKTFLLTAVILLCFAGALMVLSARLTQSWQQPTEDEADITINPTVEEFLGDKVKEYKFVEATPDNEIGKAYNHDIHLEYQDGMVTTAEAASYGGTALDKLCPDIDWSKEEFELYRQWRVTRGNIKNYFYIGRTFFPVVDGEEWRYSRAEYNVDLYTGEVTLLARFDKDAMECLQRKDITEQHRERVMERAVEVSEIMGWGEIAEYEYFDYSNSHNLIVRAESVNGDVWRIFFYYLPDEDFPLERFEKTNWGIDKVKNVYTAS